MDKFDKEIEKEIKKKYFLDFYDERFISRKFDLCLEDNSHNNIHKLIKQEVKTLFYYLRKENFTMCVERMEYTMLSNLFNKYERFFIGLECQKDFVLKKDELVEKMYNLK